MTIAIALIALLLVSLWFHFAGGWSLPPLASNWSDIDLTIGITLAITGLVFIAVVVFMAYAVYRFRYRRHSRSQYQPENKRLELWLTGFTAVGITAMLVPGLYVYSDIVTVPDEAHQVEVLAQQWSWQFRLPGDDGVLGKTDIKRIGPDNPFGIDPVDPAGQDDRLVVGNRLHLPVGIPVQVLLRSKDVLHDFYVPQFRNKMDAVPGIVSSLWFTPVKLGEFEILCAELCGVGHFNMRGAVVVQEPEQFQQWLTALPTFAEGAATAANAGLSPQAREGESLAQSQGCLACHGFETSPLAPSWLGLYGKVESFTDGSQRVVDDDYLIEAIVDPGASLVQGYTNVMPPYAALTELQLAALIAYIKERGGVATDSAEPAAASPASPSPSEPAEVEATELDGAQLAQVKGCIACHSLDGRAGIGPSWLGLAGSERTLADGRVVVADEAYLRRAMLEPAAELVQGYQPLMPPMPLTENEVQALIDYLKQLSP
ncbi:MULTISPECIES: cytochrome c oxidase subunit II [Ferrimonas]|uniref:cytochrome c oxidase subunit II n=1 Tax=Ferrimonas TaxID=44011 RepID=UPI0004022A32|nr:MULTISPECIES: cytochrome c oxidase subunit II [Ferrimonas]USD39131.1 cytochrome c oxidase subunit II [Ferrimonas sp. SCSIO 43195]